MANVRQAMFPYGMSKRADGAWFFFNRSYKPVGVTSSDWADWDDPSHKLRLKGLGPATLAKLDHGGKGGSDRIYFYDDASNPELSASNMDAYLKKLRILLSLQEASD
jgi:hypothetical protein